MPDSLLKGRKYHLKALLSLCLNLLLLAACTLTPTGRLQLKLFPSGQVDRMGDAAYQQIKRETPISPDPAVVRYVNCITEALAAVGPPAQEVEQWRVTVFEGDHMINAFALPGGNLGVYTGMVEFTENPDQLAAVIGHEMAHVIAKHGNARISTQFATRTSLSLIQILTGAPATPTGQQLMALLGLGAQVGIILPFSRGQEREADLLGMEYMARAGFEPHQNIQLWRNMMAIEAPRPPAFLSTHPTDEARIRALEKHLPEALELYQQARNEPRRPECAL
jgi:predicted Zn-dependent protease